MNDHELKAVVRQAFDQLANHGVVGVPNGALAYAYIRVSSAGQADEQRSGLPRQLAHIAETAHASRLTIPFEFVYADDHTGFEFRDRPGLQALLTEIKKPKRPAHHLLIEDIDRLSRNAKWHQGYLLDIFAEHSVSVSFWKPFSSEIERAVLGAISEQGMRNSIDRMMKGTRHKATTGRVTAKEPAYGYMLVDSQGRPASDPASNYRKDSHYALHPDQAPIVREIYERIGRNGESLYQVCDDLTVRGLPTAGGAAAWSNGNVSKLLRNPVYKGEYAANRFRNVKEWNEHTQRMVRLVYERPQEEWIIIPVPAIVSAELWDITHATLQKHIRTSTRKLKREFLLQSFVRCARCNDRYA